MASVRSAIMRHNSARRVATNTGHIIRFAPGQEVTVPGIVVAECRKAGAEIVRYVGGTQEAPESIRKDKVPELISSESSFVEDEADPNEISEEVLERVSSSTDEDDTAEADAAVKKIDNFSQKETRISNAILAIISEGNEDHFVASTGMPKVNVISDRLGGENVTSTVRDLVWKKMESNGLLGTNSN